ncbi:hypothetical protein OG555_36145 [Kribbella sp. NBC_01484]|uniref:hypothetical protein n=1 Tax=Kribbella sp. NBC_01484 TaxID=2903579 RepID=UPI002E37F287|nr:hypothetical protein [Kribbella sp. NBC_01484]
MIGVTGCVSSSTKIDIFWLNAGNGIGHTTGTGTAWGVPGEELGGEFLTVPAAAATNSPQLGYPELVDVFAVGPDFAMYNKQSAHGTWTADWLDLQGDFASAPGVISRADGRLDVFAVGNDYAMYHRFRTGLGSKTRWSPGWEYLGGRFSSTAGVVSRDGVSIDVFARGADFTLRHRRNVQGTWSSDWQNLGGSLASPPAAVSWGPARMDVFAVGTDRALWHRWWDGEIWSDWESLGGALTDTPSVTSWGPGRLDVFGLGLDGRIVHYWFDDQAWSGRESLSGVIAGELSSGPVALAPAYNLLNIAVSGAGAAWGKIWDGVDWTPTNFDQVGFGVRLPTTYRFSVDRVQVTNTRSLNSDTDAAVAAVAAGNWPIRTATQRTGDIGGVSDPQGMQLDRLSFEPVTVELCEASLFNYLILNNGHADAKVLDDALVKAAGSITSDGVQGLSKGIGAGLGAIVGIELIGTAILAPVIGSLLGSLVDYLLSKVGTVVFADCDGLVAAESVALSGRDLFLKTKDAGLTVTTTHHGTDSADGCGANSVYDVTWTIDRIAAG